MTLSRFDFLIFFILLFLSLFLIFFNQNIAVSKLHQSVARAVLPAQLLLNQLRNPYMFWTNALFNIRNIKTENQELIQKNLELEANLTKLTSLEQENNLLRNQLNFAHQTSKNLAGANIISRDYQNSRSFIIDKGEDSGINNGMAVIADGGNIVGQIIWTGKKSSVVRTIFDASTKVNASVQKSRVSALARGLGTDLILDLVPKSQELQIGDIVVSSGRDGIWPQGLIVGRITSIYYSPNQIFKTAHLESQLDWAGLDKVFVILPR